MANISGRVTYVPLGMKRTDDASVRQCGCTVGFKR